MSDSGAAGLTIHAGVPKAGSSSIQTWLAENAERLRSSHDTVVAVAREGAPITTGIFDGSGTINSAALVKTMIWGGDDRTPALNAFLADLGSLCEAHAHVIVTSEAFESFLWRPDEDFVLGLESFAARHPVRVVYYLRPQHAALEAAWRQWGFRSKGPPSLFLTLRADRMEYASSYARAKDLAPTIELIPRALREDLLDGGDVVADFANRYLGLGNESLQREFVNPSLPLEVVNLLREAPPGTFWDSIHDNATLGEIKQLLANLDLPESDRIRRSRAVLQAYCHERFEPGNLELIQRMGWPVSDWVPAPEEPVRGHLAELDSLWSPQASNAERQVLFAAILGALGR
ncbi:MAG TPA: hypothetical protein VD766_08590 [Solirubrobacterales bacterium]|nr:hypothetical protein [Solirubrobacterales bacterium]